MDDCKKKQTSLPKTNLRCKKGYNKKRKCVMIFGFLSSRHVSDTVWYHLSLNLETSEHRISSYSTETCINVRNTDGHTNVTNIMRFLYVFNYFFSTAWLLTAWLQTINSKVYVEKTFVAKKLWDSLLLYEECHGCLYIPNQDSNDGHPKSEAKMLSSLQCLSVYFCVMTP